MFSATNRKANPRYIAPHSPFGMVPRPVAKEFKVFSEELSHHEGTFAFLVSIVLRQEVFQMTDREETSRRGVRGFVRDQFRKFWSDPLSYALDRFIQAFFLSIAIVIIGAAIKMIASAVASIVT